VIEKHLPNETDGEKNEVDWKQNDKEDERE